LRVRKFATFAQQTYAYNYNIFIQHFNNNLPIMQKHSLRYSIIFAIIFTDRTFTQKYTFSYKVATLGVHVKIAQNIQKEYCARTDLV